MDRWMKGMGWNGLTVGQTDEQVGSWIDGRVDKRTDGRTVGWMGTDYKLCTNVVLCGVLDSIIHTTTS